MFLNCNTIFGILEVIKCCGFWWHILLYSLSSHWKFMNEPLYAYSQVKFIIASKPMDYQRKLDSFAVLPYYSDIYRCLCGLHIWICIGNIYRISSYKNFLSFKTLKLISSGDNWACFLKHTLTLQRCLKRHQRCMFFLKPNLEPLPKIVKYKISICVYNVLYITFKKCILICIQFLQSTTFIVSSHNDAL